MAIQVRIEYELKSWVAKLSEVASVERLIPAIVTAMNLPLINKPGQSFIYHLHNDSRQLRENETLSAAGVKDGDVLNITRSTPQEVPDSRSARLRQLFMKRLPNLDDSFLTSVSDLKQSRTNLSSRQGKSSQHNKQTVSGQNKTVAPIICPRTETPCGETLGVDQRRAYIIMPFDDESDNLYQRAIEPTVIKAGLHPVRGENAFTNADLLCKICHCVFESRLNIVDISSINANVFLHLGVVYGMGRQAILIKKYDSKVLRDIEALEYIPGDDFQIFNRRLLTILWQSTGAPSLRGWPCEECGKIPSSSNFFIACTEDGSVYHPDCWYSLGKCRRCQGTQVVEIRRDLR